MKMEVVMLKISAGKRGHHRPTNVNASIF